MRKFFIIAAVFISACQIVSVKPYGSEPSLVQSATIRYTGQDSTQEGIIELANGARVVVRRLGDTNVEARIVKDSSGDIKSYIGSVESSPLTPWPQGNTVSVDQKSLVKTFYVDSAGMRKATCDVVLPKGNSVKMEIVCIHHS